MEALQKRDMLVSKAWLQAVAVVVLFGFFVLGLLAYRTYSGEAPIPGRVVDPEGRILFTREDIQSGQQVFLRNGLMEYGSIFGHGAYLGPDYTADYLRRSALSVLDSHGKQKLGSASDVTVTEFKTNRYDPASDTLAFTQAQSVAHSQLTEYYRSFFNEPSTRYGLRPQAISDRRQTDQLTAFFAWSAWVASTLRPGKDYSYTNNWPPEPLWAIGYAMLLVVIATALERIAAHSHRRADQYHTGGFRFRKDSAHWECPMGERLQMIETDHELRVIRYQAPARTCNGCSMKPDCTDSDNGRTISVPMDPWLKSAIGRFHRGISLLLLVLASQIIVIELFRHNHGIERLVLATVMIMVSLLCINLARSLREHLGADP